MVRRVPPRSSDDDRRLWARVTDTVTPQKPRRAPLVEPAPPAPAPPDPTSIAPTSRPASQPPRPPAAARTPVRPAAPETPSRHPRAAPGALEPRRERRLARERDPIEARIDLHGHGRFEAEDVLVGFLMGCQARGLRAVLVITGQGRRGGGIIRASAAEWLQGPRLRGVVAGFSSAHRRHGGDGALYVTLRRRE